MTRAMGELLDRSYPGGAGEGSSGTAVSPVRSTGPPGASSRPGRGSHGLAALPPRDVAAVLGVSGIAVAAVTETGGFEALWAEDPVSLALADLHFTLGEGPGVDAATAAGALMREPDLSQTPADRWTGFVPEAIELGIAALFAFPLRLG